MSGSFKEEERKVKRFIYRKKKEINEKLKGR